MPSIVSLERHSRRCSVLFDDRSSPPFFFKKKNKLIKNKPKTMIVRRTDQEPPMLPAHAASPFASLKVSLVSHPRRCRTCSAGASRRNLALQFTLRLLGTCLECTCQLPAAQPPLLSPSPHTHTAPYTSPGWLSKHAPSHLLLVAFRRDTKKWLAC